MGEILQTSALTKHFGKIRAVQQLNLSVENGQVFGILGPNGSGKTTTLGMILGVTSKTSGSYSWFGSGENFQLRKRIGAILEHPIFYPYMNGLQNLRVTKTIKEIKDPPYDEVLEKVGLYERRKDAFRTYSLGMKQRLAIASSLLSDPDVLIFDEPTNGLDPQGIAEIRQTIIGIAEMGKTIILASHLLDEVQKVCTHFAVLRKGKKLYDGSVAEVLERKGMIELRAVNMESLRQALMDSGRIQNLSSENGQYIIEGTLTPGELNKYLIDRGIIVNHLYQRHSNLEEQFLEILKEDDGKAF